MKRFFKAFQREEAGAVTVDWVVLCAAIVGLVVIVLTIMQNNSTGLADAVAGFLTGWTF